MTKNVSLFLLFSLIGILSYAQVNDTTYTLKNDSLKTITTVTTTTTTTVEPLGENVEAESQKAKTKNTKEAKPKKKSSFKVRNMIIGGSLGFSFGTVTSIRLNPLLGYKLTPKLTTGITGLYEYNSYNYAGYGRQNYSNYGASIFSRFRFIPSIYLHAEFSYTNYEFSGFNNEKYRQGVPFIFLGGGFAQRVGRNTYAYGQILFDVLQDSNSPYAEWAPFYSVGVSVGF